MCDPLTIAGSALAVGGAVAGEVSKSKAAKDNKEATLRQLSIDFSEINARQFEENRAASNQVLAASRQESEASGTLLAQAAGANLSGLSVRALLQEIAADAAEFRSTTQDNLQSRTRQLEREKRAAREAANARIKGVPGGSLLSGALQIGGIGISTLDRLKLRTPAISPDRN